MEPETSRVFISWSKQRSHHVALNLREWLQLVLQGIEVWMSSADIEAGARWSREIEEQLEQSDFGVLCVTPENVREPWLLFEAGALAKRVDRARVVPYLIGLSPSEIPAGPLTLFQAKSADRIGTFELLSAINARRLRPLTSDQLRLTFDRWWDWIGGTLAELPPPVELPARSEGAVLDELLELSRSISRMLSDQRQPPIAGMSFGQAPLAGRSGELLRELLNNSSRLRAAGVIVNQVAYTVGGDPVIIVAGPGGGRSTSLTGIRSDDLRAVEDRILTEFGLPLDFTLPAQG